VGPGAGEIREQNHGSRGNLDHGPKIAAPEAAKSTQGAMEYRFCFQGAMEYRPSGHYVPDPLGK